MDFKELIKVRRKELGLTLEEVAKACNVTKATVMRWENGNIVNIKKDKIYPLAKILKLDPIIFFSGDSDCACNSSYSNIGNIGERIKKIRLENNLTQDELAKRCGYSSRSTISKIEDGERNLTSKKIETIAKALNTTPAYLMGWQPDGLDDEDGEVVETMTNEEKKELLNALKVVRNECKKHMDEKCNNCCLCTDEGCKLKIDAPRDWCLSNEKKDIWRAFN